MESAADDLPDANSDEDGLDGLDPRPQIERFGVFEIGLLFDQFLSASANHAPAAQVDGFDYVHRLVEALNEAGKPLNGSKICILGVAYKKDVDDPRESTSFELMELLRAGKAVISYNDPHVPVLPRVRGHQLPELSSVPLDEKFLASQDCVLIATDHSAYDYDFIVRNARMVIDTRNSIK